jgi:hypothetical protein
MPIKRRTSKAMKHRITPDAIEAFIARDYLALHRALGLAPWEASPLPLSVSPLGVDPDDPPTGDGTGWEASWPLALELQRELQKAVRDA